MGGNDSSKLWTAIQDGDKTSIRKLLKKGIDPNSRSSYQYIQNVSVLMVASHKGYKEIVQLLLESGAKIHQTDSVSAVQSNLFHHSKLSL
jgi:ankyrin repeat protein